MIGQEDDFTVSKWTWFDTQVSATFMWSWLTSQALVDFTDMGRISGCTLDDLQAPYVSMNNSIRAVPSYFYTIMVVHPGSNDHLRIRDVIYRNIISSSSKKQKNGKVSLKNGILGVDCKMTINMLIKYLYIAVQHLYITN